MVVRLGGDSESAMFVNVLKVSLLSKELRLQGLKTRPCVERHLPEMEGMYTPESQEHESRTYA